MTVTLLSFITLFVCGVAMIVTFAMCISDDFEGEALKNVISVGACSRKWFITALVCICLVQFLPDCKTVTAMAASEFGTRVLQSEQAQKIIDPGLKVVEQWLNKQLEVKKEQK